MTARPLIIHLPQGKVAPEAFLKKACVLHPTAFGFAGRKDGKLVFENSGGMPPLKELMELQNALKDDHLVMYMANLPKAVLPDDVQPYLIGNGEEDLEKFVGHLAVFYAGNFDKYAGMDGDHTADYCVYDEAIVPKLQKWMTETGGKPEDFFAKLREPGAQKSLSNIYDGTGVYVMLPSVGDPIMFGNNPAGKEFPWGNVSDTCGYSEAVQNVKEAVKAAPKNVLGFLNKHVAGPPAADPATPPPAPAPDPAPTAPHPDADPKVTEKHVKAPEPTAHTPTKAGLQGPVYPPKKLAQGKARNLWLRTFNGESPGKLPDNHESSTCAIYVEPELFELAKAPYTDKKSVENVTSRVHLVRKSLKEGGTLPPDLAAQAVATAEAARAVLLDKDKTTSKSTVREKFVGTPSNGTSQYIPVMSADEKQDGFDKLVTYLDPSNKKRPTPLEIQKMESEWPAYSEQLGVQFTDLLFLTPDQLTELLGKKGACAFIEMKRMYINSGDVKLEDLVLSTKGEESTVKSEAESAKPAEQVASKQSGNSGGVLGFLRPKKVA